MLEVMLKLVIFANVVKSILFDQQELHNDPQFRKKASHCRGKKKEKILNEQGSSIKGAMLWTSNANDWQAQKKGRNSTTHPCIQPHTMHFETIKLTSSDRKTQA